MRSCEHRGSRRISNTTARARARTKRVSSSIAIGVSGGVGTERARVVPNAVVNLNQYQTAHYQVSKMISEFIDQEEFEGLLFASDQAHARDLEDLSRSIRVNRVSLEHYRSSFRMFRGPNAVAAKEGVALAPLPEKGGTAQ